VRSADIQSSRNVPSTATHRGKLSNGPTASDNMTSLHVIASCPLHTRLQAGHPDASSLQPPSYPLDN